MFTIDDVTEGYLDEALGEIAELEDYAYREANYEQVGVSDHILRVALWGLLVWVTMVGTLWLPLRKGPVWKTGLGNG